MGLTGQIDQDITTALKAGEELKVSTLRLVKSALHNQEIAAGHELSDEEVIKVLSKELNSRKEAAESYKNAGRAEQADKEEQEQAIIQAYLPAAMSDEELTQLVEQTIKEAGATTVADMGKVMGTISPKTAGRAEGSKVAALVRDRLSQ